MGWARAGLLLLAALLPWSGASPAFGQPIDRYELQYGPPIEVSLSDLAQSPNSYYDRAIKTTGRLDMHPTVMRAFLLSDTFGNTVSIAPVPDVSFQFEEQGRKWLGRPIDVTGAFLRASVQQGAYQPTAGIPVAGYVYFWGFLGPPDEQQKGPLKATDVTLESLVTSPGKRDGQTVRVVGKFRGHNLYGDLPTQSRRRSADWVIKDDLFAVWVTGRKPKGSGWQLDASLKRDTGKWIEVVGKPETRRGVVYLSAATVTLSKPPTPTADAAPPPPPPPKPKVAPVVVFALPLDGEADVSPDTSRFLVQFSKDMDEATFEGRIWLRYVDGLRPGDRPFDAVKVSYDRGRRALVVDPGDVLREGRELELLLMPGILDTEGLALAPAKPSHVEGAVAALRWTIAG